MISQYFDKDHPDSEDHVAELRKSIKAVGHRRKVLVSKLTGNVISGAHRLAADPNWPVEYVEISSKLEEEVIGLHENLQRQMSQNETAKRIEAICSLLHSEKGIAEDECFRMAIDKGYIPYAEDYARSLCPDRFKRNYKQKIIDLSFNDANPRNLREAIELAVKIRDQGGDYSRVLVKKDKSGKAFWEQITQPEHFSEGLSKGMSAEALVRMATMPADLNSESNNVVKQRLKASEENLSVFIDEDNVKHVVYVLKVSGNVKGYDGETL